MAMPVSFSKTPQVLDAISALKITNYYGVSSLDNIYCYLRAYVLDGALVFSITSFERTPPDKSRAGVAFSFGEDKRYLFLSCNGAGKLSAQLFTAVSDGRDLPGAPVALDLPELYRGVDEQGYHWGFSLTLSAEFLAAQFGAQLKPGSVFFGNVYKFCTDEDAFGSAFVSQPARGMPDQNSFGEFVVVPY